MAGVVSVVHRTSAVCVAQVLYKCCGSHSTLFVYDTVPTFGSTSGGTRVTIYGGQFLQTRLLKCKMDGKVSRARFLRHDMIECVTPAVLFLGNVNISITNNDQVSLGQRSFC